MSGNHELPYDNSWVVSNHRLLGLGSSWLCDIINLNIEINSLDVMEDVPDVPERSACFLPIY